MRLEFNFNSLADWSSSERGSELLDLLARHGIRLEKVNEHEPVNRPFSSELFLELWQGRGVSHASASVLFSGKGRYTTRGMAIWGKNLHPSVRQWNGLSLWLNLPRHVEAKELIVLADEIFAWSDVVYGYVSESGIAKDRLHPKWPWLIKCLPGMYWLNYYGEPYLNATNFSPPKENVSIGHGVRVKIADHPADTLLRDGESVRAWMKEIGLEWFGEGKDLKAPTFDFSTLTRTSDIDAQ